MVSSWKSSGRARPESPGGGLKRATAGKRFRQGPPLARPSEHGTIPSKRRKFLADAGAMAIFWTTVYTPVFLYTSKTIDAALIGLASSTVLEITLGGVYGRFLDWFRRVLGATDKRGDEEPPQRTEPPLQKG